MQYVMKRPSVRMFLSISLAILLLMQPLIPTLATDMFVASKFSDCPVTHPHYASIATLSDMGIVSGTGASAVAPDRVITKAEYIALLVRLFHPEAQLSELQPWHVPYQKYLIEEGILRTNELYHMNSAITWEYLYPSALKACGIYPYSAQLFDDMPEISDSHLVTSSVYTLLDAGVMDTWAPLNSSPTRGEVMDFLYRLSCIEYQGPPVVAELGLTEENFQVCDLSFRWYIRNRVLEGLDLIPQKYIDYYHRKDWNFVIDEIDTRFPAFRGATGLFSGSTNTIYIDSPNVGTVLHEFGHFLWWYLDLNCYAEAMYRDKEESAGLMTLTNDDYCMTDASEWFAVAFSVVLEMHQTEAGREALNQHIPKTYAAIRDGLLYAEGLSDRAVFSRYFPVS